MSRENGCFGMILNVLYNGNTIQVKDCIEITQGRVARCRQSSTGYRRVFIKYKYKFYFLVTAENQLLKQSKSLEHLIH